MSSSSGQSVSESFPSNVVVILTRDATFLCSWILNPFQPVTCVACTNIFLIICTFVVRSLNCLSVRIFYPMFNRFSHTEHTTFHSCILYLSTSYFCSRPIVCRTQAGKDHRSRLVARAQLNDSLTEFSRTSGFAIVSPNAEYSTDTDSSMLDSLAIK